MWCEQFMTAYRDTSLVRLPEHYDRMSVLVEMTGDGQWKKPTTGARDIADRVTELNLRTAKGQWETITYQRLRAEGLIVVLTSADGRMWQIMIVNRCAAATAVVSIHFHVTVDRGDVDRRCGAAFRQHFEEWAMSLDRETLMHHRTAMRTGLSVAVDFYAASLRERRLAGNRLRWQCYDPEARFTFTCRNRRGGEGKGGEGGGRVGLRPIRERYEWLALDHGHTKLRSIECYGTAASCGDRCTSDYTAVLVLGTVPDLDSNKARCRKFVQLLVVDTRTRKIINDVLCFQQPLWPRRPRPSPANSLYELPSSRSSSSLSPSPSPSSSSSSFLSRTPPSSIVTTDAVSSTADCCSDFPSSSSTANSMDGLSTCSNDVDNGDRRGDMIELRFRVTDNALKIRSGTDAGTVLATGGCDRQQRGVPVPNPRQLFIGRVPLHVKYGQLKLLFERFGEVAFVKVYDGFNKQTGAKMMHNYAFLFFKHEESVMRAIAASPIPLDDHWNLNVSRPHQHAAAVAARGLGAR